LIDAEYVVKLRDLCNDYKKDIVDGPFGANLKREHYVDAGTPVLKIQNIKPFEIVLKKMDYVSPEKARELSRHAYRNGDIIITKLGLPLGVSAIVEKLDEGIIVADLVRVRAQNIDTRYLCYHLNSPRTSSFLNAQSGGTTRPRVRITAVRDLPIYAPPLPEQQRIVAILDEAFAGIALAVESAEKNLANAKQLVDSFLTSVFDQKKPSAGWISETYSEAMIEKEVINSTDHRSTRTGGRAATDRTIVGDLSLSVGKPPAQPRTGWKWSLLSDLARLESGHTPSRRHPEWWGGDIPWIGIKDARENHGSTILDTKQHTNELGLANSSARLLPSGTVCLSRTASVGYVLVMGKEMATSQDFVNWICTEKLEPHYLKYLLVAEGDGFTKYSSGSVHQTIYYPEVKGFFVCHPDIETQRKIIERAHKITLESQRLEIIYQQKLNALTELKQSILQKAFAGELTTEPDKALDGAGL
jgi:type I restriction enzyme, S subunit